MNKKLKVLQLIDSLAPGGAEMMAVNIANALADKNVDSFLCATRAEGDLKLKIANNVGYLFLNKKRTIDLKAIYKLHNFITAHHINTIHAHSSSYFLGFLMKLLNPTLQLIWHNHFGNSHNFSRMKSLPILLMSNYFDKIISVNNDLKEWALDNLRCNEVYMLNNFSCINTKSESVTFLNGNILKRIVCLANLREEKDHLNLLKAFSIVQNRYDNWSLHLVGMDYSDEYSGKIKDFIKRKNLQEHVFLYGSCIDVSHVLEQSTIGVLSSNFEGLPVSLLEYGLAKLPVVVTDVGGCGKVITNEENGLVVKKENEFEFSEAILKLIENESKRNLFGTNLYQRINTHYSKEAYIHQLIGIYSDAN